MSTERETLRVFYAPKAAIPTEVDILRAENAELRRHLAEREAELLEALDLLDEAGLL
jgi:hypothetical protein